MLSLTNLFRILIKCFSAILIYIYSNHKRLYPTILNRFLLIHAKIATITCFFDTYTYIAMMKRIATEKKNRVTVSCHHHNLWNQSIYQQDAYNKSIQNHIIHGWTERDHWRRIWRSMIILSQLRILHIIMLLKQRHSQNALSK